MTTKLAYLGVASIVLAAVGCAAPADPPPEEGATVLEMRALASVPLEHGGSLDIVEVAPGFLALSETGPSSREPVVTGELAKLDPEVLVAKLRPAGMEEPAELTAAFARRRERLATGIIREDRNGWTTTRDVPKLREDNLGTITQGLSSTQTSGTGSDRQQFIERWCLNTSGSWSFCDVDRWGGHSRTRSDVDEYACTGATFARTAQLVFKYRVWWSWTTFGRWTVQAGNWRRVWTEETGGLDYDGECGMYTVTDCSPVDYACMVSAPKAGFHLAGAGR